MQCTDPPGSVPIPRCLHGQCLADWPSEVCPGLCRTPWLGQTAGCASTSCWRCGCRGSRPEGGQGLAAGARTHLVNPGVPGLFQSDRLLVFWHKLSLVLSKRWFCTEGGGGQTPTQGGGGPDQLIGHQFFFSIPGSEHPSLGVWGWWGVAPRGKSAVKRQKFREVSKMQRGSPHNLTDPGNPKDRVHPTPIFFLTRKTLPPSFGGGIPGTLGSVWTPLASWGGWSPLRSKGGGGHTPT